ncbi:AAA family ATPase [Pleurostoma richardsiae]|uniref:AAA family ATPase n=1 Tax=Pleurostoma richardsiae TaxID=41990 RepID=A0AA38R9R5_9PEZI|nr:AAA family ATPase [Pleurostoma richardsiae]
MAAPPPPPTPYDGPGYNGGAGQSNGMQFQGYMDTNGSQSTASLFTDSTISKDGTRGRASDQGELLAKFNQKSMSNSLEFPDPNASQLPPPPEPITYRRPPRSTQFEIPPPVNPFAPASSYPPPPPPPAVDYPQLRSNDDALWRQSLRAARQSSASSKGGVSRKNTANSSSEPLSTEPESIENAKSHKKPVPDDGLAVSLSAIAEKHLAVDLLDQSRGVSQFTGFLLDTIQLLETQIRFLNTEEPAESEYGQDEEQGPVRERVESPAPRAQVLHRVFCTADWHNHNGFIFEDEPRVNRNDRHKPPGLNGKEHIYNLDVYLDEHPEICFVIFQEHNCAADQKLRRERGLNANVDVFETDTPNWMASSERRERIRIVSMVLLRAMTEVAEFSPFEASDLLPDYREMDAPYNFVFHHEKELADLAEQSPIFKASVTPLLEFIQTRYRVEYDEARELFGRGCITATHVGKLYKPNKILVSKPREDPFLEAYVLRDFPVKRKDKIRFRGWSWHYNGSELQRMEWKASMDGVKEEEIPISSLPIHPLEYADAEDVKLLYERGRKFWNMRKQTFMCYTGYDKRRDHYYTNARFMVDTATYKLMHPYAFNTMSWGPSYKGQIDPWPSAIARDADISDEMLMILPASTPAFYLDGKKWTELNVEDFHPVDWNKRAFERLVLDSRTKDMISALVDVQRSRDKKMDDIITGKGNGLIILLHGSPGTGKTLTAESVAELAEKPLYRVTCGDIGTDATSVEKYLQTVLYLGKTWDCVEVLLLDEADVFLEERTMADLTRNSLVSVFLRILEYHDGILILTSNRVGTFDEAFKSRIQVAIHYDSLTRMSRKQIWRNFLDMIEEAHEDANMSELERRLDELAAQEMNGRQIRNALLTARQLAKHKSERLDWAHLSQVIKTSAAFNKYLKTVRGHTDEQWAREEMLR